jgi:peroxiredoxin
MLQRGDAVPHFEVRTAEGAPFSYSSIWQRKNLLLVTLPTLDSDSTAYMSNLIARLRDLTDQDLECVVTRELIPGVGGSAVVVADRWGEVVYSVAKSDVANLPAPPKLVEWVTYLNNECPECEGEAR